MRSAPFVRRRCDCLASSALITSIQTYLLTYLLTAAYTDDDDDVDDDDDDDASGVDEVLVMCRPVKSP